MLLGRLLNGSVQMSTVEAWDSNANGWDKSSDFNVQVIGEVPEPGSWALAAVALLAAGATTRRRAG